MLRLPTFTYLAPRTLAEAADLYLAHAPEAMLLAGGTDYFPNMKQRLFTPKYLVGIGALPELRQLTVDPHQGASLGAGVSIARLATDPTVRQHYRALARAAGLVSTPQLRSAGTIGGNVCLDTRCNWYNQSLFWRTARDFCLKKGGDICRVAPSSNTCWAVYSGDTVPVLMTLGATVGVTNAHTGSRRMSLGDVYSGDGIKPLVLGIGDIVTDVRLPAPGAWRSTYHKLRVRQAFDYPILGLAAAVLMDGDVVRQARLVLGAIATRPLPVPEAEALLVGQPLSDAVIAQAAEAAFAVAHPTDNTSGTIGYRRRMVRVFVRRALEELRAEPADLSPSSVAAA